MRVAAYLTCGKSSIIPCLFAFAVLVLLLAAIRHRDRSSSVFGSTIDVSDVAIDYRATSLRNAESSSSSLHQSSPPTSVTLPSCSFRIFRDQLRQSKDTFLSGDGTWTRRQTGSLGNGGGIRRRGLPLGQLQASHVASNFSIDPLFRFRPVSCSISYGAWLPRSSLSSCLCRLNVSYIVLNGDSNAWRIFRLSNKFLVGGGGTDDRSTVSDADGSGLGAGGRRGGIRCERVASHDGKRRGKPGPFEGGAYMPLKRPECSIVYRLAHWHLPPDYYRCWIACSWGELPLSIQYLPMTSDWTPYEEFLIPEQTGCPPKSMAHGLETTTNETTHSRPASSYSSYQEFLYDEYYATEPRPDLVLHFSSSHEQSPLAEYASKVDSLVNLFRRSQQIQQQEQSTGSSTHITRTIVISKPAENVRLKPKKWRDVRYESTNISRAEWISAANHILHSRVAPLFISSASVPKNVLLFPDLASTMDPVIDELSVDGVHASSFWYRTLWSYIVQTLCTADIRQL